MLPRIPRPLKVKYILHTCDTKRNCNNNCLQTGFQNTPLFICHWPAKQVAPPLTHATGCSNLQSNVLIAPQSHSVYIFKQNQPMNGLLIAVSAYSAATGEFNIQKIYFTISPSTRCSNPELLTRSTLFSHFQTAMINRWQANLPFKFKPTKQTHQYLQLVKTDFNFMFRIPAFSFLFHISYIHKDNTKTAQHTHCF